MSEKREEVYREGKRQKAATRERKRERETKSTWEMIHGWPPAGRCVKYTSHPPDLLTGGSDCEEGEEMMRSEKKERGCIYDWVLMQGGERRGEERKRRDG